VDFPIYHLDFFGNRMLIAVIAVLHVLINHPLAVGAMPLVTLMEWWGYRRRDAAWDELAYKMLFVCFIITTSVGALTGVGIWLSASLINPAAIGSLIRVFFLAWFTEWIVFVLEVTLILVYFLTWKKWTPGRKRLHIATGAFLSLFSWLTMAIIVAVLGFMMNTGEWTENPSLLTGVLNPIYLPQLAFRTPFAIVTAGLFALFLIPFFTKRRDPVRAGAVRFVAAWVILWLPLCYLGGRWYWNVIPETMAANLPIAVATQNFTDWHDTVILLLRIGVVAITVVGVWGVVIPRYLPRAALVLPFVLAIVLFGYFERVREFIRKPHVVQGYMYANGIREADYPLFKAQGMLAHAAYASTRTITDENRLEAGRDVFLIACTRCHTTRGVNGAVAKFENLFGYGPWEPEKLQAYIAAMHNARPFMPPFPGNDQELDAMVAYLCWLQQNRVPLAGAQTVGAVLPKH
jgi:hypothetical protein